MSSFSTRLLELRKNKGDTVQSMAEMLGISGRAYQYYEEGKREPNFGNLILLCRYYHVSSDYLLGLSDKP